MKRQWQILFLAGIFLSAGMTSVSAAEKKGSLAGMDWTKRDSEMIKRQQPHTTTVRPQGDGSYRIYRDGVPTGTVSPQSNGDLRYKEQKNIYDHPYFK